MILTINCLKELVLYRGLLKQLILRDVKLRYRRSFFGYLWSVLNPLFIMFIMIIVFTQVFRADIVNFPLYLISGQILFNYMSESTNGALTSIIASGSLIKKSYVPKYIFTMAKVTSTLINMLLSLVALFIVAIVTMAPISWKYIFAIVPIVEIYIFSLGLGLFLAQIAVFFRDIQYIYSIVIVAWTYLTPIFYPVSILEGSTIGVIITKLNPMHYYISQFRSIVMYAAFSPVKSYFIGFISAFVILIIGTWSFQRNQDNFILYI